jgi:hypothetical protein
MYISEKFISLIEDSTQTTAVMGSITSAGQNALDSTSGEGDKDDEPKEESIVKRYSPKTHGGGVGPGIITN